MKTIVRCAVSGTTRDFDIEYSYILPEELMGKAPLGMRVMVPFGPSDRLREAFIIAFEGDGSLEGLKEVRRIADKEPLLNERTIELIRWMKKRYICTYYDAIRCVIPQIILSGETKAKKKMVYFIKEGGDISGKMTEKQRAVFDGMEPGEEYTAGELCERAKVSTAVVKGLLNKGYIGMKTVIADRSPFLKKDVEPVGDHVLTPAQEGVFEGLKKKLKGGHFEQVLLHGVTGSGKTEIYIQLIRETLKLGRQAIVLVPEISLTPQIINTFRGRFDDNIAVLHSRLSVGERYDQWNLIKEGKKDIVIGARSAVFAPLNNIGLVIIDEEHEYTYKSETTPKYSTDEVAAYLCKINEAMLVLGSATPGIETYHRAKSGQMDLLVLKNRINEARLPLVEIVDMKEELKQGNRRTLSRRLKGEIEKNLMDGNQSIILLNRRGYSTFVLCRNCGYVCKCPHCSISMTYHFNSGYVICHYCGYAISAPRICPACSSDKIRYFGSGTQKLEQDIIKAFPRASILRMDMDTTSGKDSHEKILDKFQRENIDILVGTQMVAKGHDFPRVTLVGVLAADSILNFPDFRAGERTFQLITQVAGRAGRGTKPGRVVVQAYNTEEFSILCAADHDYESFYEKEIQIRERLKIPPFKKIGQAMFTGTRQGDVKRAAQMFVDILSEVTKNLRGLEIFGPLKPPIEKIKDTYRYRVIVKADHREDIVLALENALDGYSRLKKEFPRGKMPLAGLDTNPYNML